MLKTLFFALTLTPMWLCSIEFMKDYFDYNSLKPLPNVPSDLVYDEGTTEITTQINKYQTIKPNQPIQGSIFITHLTMDKIDESSFRLGEKPLKASFVSSTQMSPTSKIAVAIYSFQLEGLPPGIHTMPPLHVKVGDRDVQALPLVIEILNQ